MKSRLRIRFLIFLFLITFLFLLIISFSANFIYAFGVSMSYGPGKYLIMQKGETKDIQMDLQSQTSIKIKSEIIKGKEIASFIDKNPVYDVSPGKLVPVKIKIKIPKDFNEEKPNLVFLFTDITPSSEEGSISFMPGSEVSLPVIISDSLNISEEKTKGENKSETKEEPKPEINETKARLFYLGFIVFLGLIIFVLAITIIIIYSRKYLK